MATYDTTKLLLEDRLGFKKGTVPRTADGALPHRAPPTRCTGLLIPCTVCGAGTVPNTVSASLVVSATVTASTTPVDFLRTQMMAGAGASGGMLAIASNAVRTHGPLVLWRGWLPMYMRILPYGTLQFTFMERIASVLGSSMT